MSVLFDTYARFDANFVRGQGSWLFTDQGDTFLDFAAGIAVNSLGHNHPAIVKALKEQADKLWHVSNMYSSELQTKLATRLCDLSFADQVFFTNSGAEACEAAVKTARRYFFTRNDHERRVIITFKQAFHGRTLAMIAAGGQERHMEGFEPHMPGFVQATLNDIESVRALINDQTAAIMLEPIQGEGGLAVASAGFMQQLRTLADEHGILLILDEVQCGNSRTGTFFAHEQSGIKPDILATAKGIGNGFPLGACLATATAAKGMIAGTHGTTYGGNALAMAVGLAVTEIITKPSFLQDVAEKGRFFRARLETIVARRPDMFTSVRGMGLMLGLKCTKESRAVVESLRGLRLLSVAAGDQTIRLLPPLNVTKDEIEQACRLIESLNT